MSEPGDTMKWIIELDGGPAFPANAEAACRIAATGRPVGYLAEVFSRLAEAIGRAKAATATPKESGDE